jgi:dipeptidyl aminopeptidase/acylaminoacyl peptidase
LRRFILRQAAPPQPGPPQPGPPTDSTGPDVDLALRLELQHVIGNTPGLLPPPDASQEDLDRARERLFGLLANGDGHTRDVLWALLSGEDGKPQPNVLQLMAVSQPGDQRRWRGWSFLRVDGESGRSGGVWSLNADGSDPVDLVKRSGVPGGAPDWSPDGTKIAFVGKRLGERFGVYVMNADGSDPIRLTSQAYEAQSPDWSPDGSRTAFTIVRGGQFDIYVMNADGSGLRQLTRAPGEDNGPEWSPDGTQIVYGHVSTGLWMMNADGTGQHRLTSLAGEPSWSPDGAWIAFDCAPSSDPDGGVCAIHPDGTGRTPILGSSGSFPAWRP